MNENPNDRYGARKAKERFEKTLRGALSAPHKPLKSVPRKSEPKFSESSYKKGRRPEGSGRRLPIKD